MTSVLMPVFMRKNLGATLTLRVLSWRFVKPGVKQEFTRTWERTLSLTNYIFIQFFFSFAGSKFSVAAIGFSPNRVDSIVESFYHIVKEALVINLYKSISATQQSFNSTF